MLNLNVCENCEFHNEFAKLRRWMAMLLWTMVNVAMQSATLLKGAERMEESTCIHHPLCIAREEVVVSVVAC